MQLKVNVLAKDAHCFRTYLFFGSAVGLFFRPAAFHVIIDKTSGLHEGVNRRGAHKLPAQLL